jgi:hypothetical protein
MRVRGAVRSEWRRSSACNTSECVEVAFAPNVVRVRATGIAGVDLVFGRAQWAAFVAAVRAGEFSSRTGR